MSYRKKLMRDLATALLLLAPASWTATLAQDYPTKTVNIVDPFQPSGGADILARLIAKHLGSVWGQTVTVENKPGAAGTIGANAVGASAPDGHTLLVGASGALTPDNAKLLAPVSLLSAPPYIVAVTPSLPVATLQDLIGYAKANPTKVFYGSSGPGSASHLSG
ncbi:MAG: hypothetical protein IPK29_17725 [Betaproteobacteria bacterium]|nr:hypothetical protein [Betaproteobacteria bacterium]